MEQNENYNCDVHKTHHRFMNVIISDLLFPGFYYYSDGGYFYHQRNIYKHGCLYHKR